ncbi:Na/Pi symporter [Mycoplasma iguanae]|uniref:Na/Pi symporter n=1 Tax=Mycoplasma iguanae TaxID=292461 RepID=A0ABY5R8D6_9MOLU|nr:Na/Pi symporter [Mycoplasma iguanae]UVD81703.1 Na/Pi symporter [Mycoplasma iguanae]
MKFTINSNSDIGLAIIIALAGIGLFVFTIKLLGNSLKALAGPKFRKVLLKIAKNRLLAVFFGMVFTTLIQSSDGAIAIIMGLLAAGLVDLRGAIAFLLGANIGTATTSLIVFFQSQLKFTNYFYVFIFIGVFGIVFARKETWNQLFSAIFAAGLVFLSLSILGMGVRAISDQDWFKNIVLGISSNYFGSYFFSIAFTGMLQSSSATVAIYQKVYESQPDIVGLWSAIALVLGANVGTTFTGLIISFASRDTNSKKIAVVWGLTNLSVSLLVMAGMWPYAKMIEAMNISGGTLQLSVAHLMFNVLLVSIYIWLVGPLDSLMHLIFRTKPKDQKINFLLLPPELIHQEPLLALEAAKNALMNLINKVNESVAYITNFLKTKDQQELSKYQENSEIIYIAKREIYAYLMKLSQKQLTNLATEEHMSLLLSTIAIGNVYDLSKEINNEIYKVFSKSKKTFLIEEKQQSEILELLELNTSIFEKITKQITKFSKKRSLEIKKMTNQTDDLSIAYFKNNVSRIKENSNSNIIELEKGFDYAVVLRTFEKMSHRLSKIKSYFKPKSTTKLNKKETIKASTV